MIDYLGFIILKFLGPLIRLLPLGFIHLLGRAIGGLMYHLDLKHRQLAYSNVKLAFGERIEPAQISRIVKGFYSNFGQNLIEIFLIPVIDEKYLKKYVKIEGMENVEAAFKRGKGVILLGVHAGSWELSNIICANLGFPFRVFVRDQKMPHLNKLLNSYRRKKGCKLIMRQLDTRQVIEALKSNEAVGMTQDQGGKSGTLVKFFGKEASMPTGALRLAMKYDAAIVPAYYARIKGPYQKVIFLEPFELKASGDKDADLRINLQEIVLRFQGLISKYPQEYFWPYKIWKYSRERNILILSDAKAGHLRQSYSLSKIISGLAAQEQIKTTVDTLEIEFKSKFLRRMLTLGSCFSGKYSCQGCLWCLKRCLTQGTYARLLKLKPDIVISSGSALAAVNFLISRENNARSIAAMRPSVLSTRRFDLVIMPKHDNPPARKNVIVTDGALNPVDEDYLKQESGKLSQSGLLRGKTAAFSLGLLIGGDTRNFRLSPDTVSRVIKELKSVSQDSGADILATTSRRTCREIESLLKEELDGFPGCKLLTIANEANPPFIMGGILGLSAVSIVSPESISMISEAVSSGKYVIVFDCEGLGSKHRRFLEYFVAKGHIHLIVPRDLGGTIRSIIKERPPVPPLRDNLLIAEGLRKIL